MTPEDLALRERLLRRCAGSPLDDIECAIRERLPVSVECHLTRRRSADLPPGTVRVTIEEPALPSSEDGLFDPWGTFFADLEYLRTHRWLVLGAALLGLLLGVLVGFLARGGLS